MLTVFVIQGQYLIKTLQSLNFSHFYFFGYNIRYLHLIQACEVSGQTKVPINSNGSEFTR